MGRNFWVICCLLSGCATDLESRCSDLKASMDPDIAIVRQAARDNNMDKVEFKTGMALGKIEAAIIFGCEFSK